MATNASSATDQSLPPNAEELVNDTEQIDLESLEKISGGGGAGSTFDPNCQPG